MLSTFLINQSDDVILGIMALGDPVWKNINPKNQKIAIQMFRRSRFQTTPRYDLFKNTVSCGNQKIRFGDPDWSKLPCALVADILTYCIKIPEHVEDYGNGKFDYPFAQRCSGGRIVNGMRVFYRLSYGFPNRYHDCELRFLNEFSFFDPNWNIYNKYELQRIMVNIWNEVIRKSLLANRDMFHAESVRTIEDARNIIGIPEGVVVPDQMETALRRTKHIGAYSYETHDPGHPTIRYSGMCDGVFVSMSQPLPTDARYDFLFYKFGINASRQTRHQNTPFPYKDLMMDADYQFMLRQGAVKKGKNGVHAPTMFPIPGATTFDATQRNCDIDLVWTGRMRFYRTWQSEYSNIRTGETGFIKQGNMFRSNMRDLVALYVKDLTDSGHLKQVPLYCHKYREWVSYATILDEMFERVNKIRGVKMDNPTADALRVMRNANPTKKYDYPWF